MKDYDSQVEIVTDKKEASPHVRFKYVYIPCDVSEPMEEREMVTTKAEAISCLMDVLRPHFKQKGVGALSSEAQKQKLKENMEVEMRKAASQGKPCDTEVSSEMVEVMSQSQTVDIVPLIPAIAVGNYMTVTIYVDDKGSVKDLPVNHRATGVVAAAGGSVTVMGDAFVARAFDNEAEDMVRHDFTLSEVDAASSWLKEAWRIKRVIEQTREGVAQDKAAAIAEVDAACFALDTADGYSFVPRIHPPLSAQERLAAAEDLRGKGNLSFKEGQVQGALSVYMKSLRYLDVYPELEGEGAKAARVSASLNVAMCCLKLSHFPQCLSICNAVLKIEAKNAKALFRKGCALRSLQRWDEAVSSLRGAAEGAPDDAAVAAELAKAEKELKKNVYGW